MDPTQYEKLIADARSHTNQKIEAAKQKYGLGTYSRFEIDLPSAAIRFLDDKGAEKIRSDIQVAGTWDAASTAWLWAWDNDSIPAAARSKLSRVQEFGEKNQLEYVAYSFDNCDEGHAWSMASLAAELLEAECVYRAPTKTSYTFLLLFNIKTAG